MAWKVCFTHLRDGTAGDGTKEADLVAAVRAGKTIRISMVMGDGGRDRFSFVPNIVIVKNEHVYAQHSQVGGHWGPNKAKLEFANPMQMITENFCSTGNVVSLIATQGSAAAPFVKDSQHAMIWYVEE